MQTVVLGRTAADLYIDYLVCKVNKHLSGKLFHLMA